MGQAPASHPTVSRHPASDPTARESGAPRYAGRDAATGRRALAALGAQSRFPITLGHGDG
jgi:hypothetical protein